VELQAQPAPHWQVPLHAQRSPQVHRPIVAFAHPHDAFSHRHCFWVSFVIGFLLFAARCLARCHRGKRTTCGRITPGPGWIAGLHRQGPSPQDQHAAEGCATSLPPRNVAPLTAAALISTRFFKMYWPSMVDATEHRSCDSNP